MSFFKRLFGRESAPKAKLAPVHRLNLDIDLFYSEIDVEQIGHYQHYFDRIIERVDVHNYTLWSQSRPYDREKLDEEDEWMLAVLEEAQEAGLSGGTSRT